MDIHASPVGMSPHMPQIKSTGKKSTSGKVINCYFTHIGYYNKLFTCLIDTTPPYAGVDSPTTDLLV
jgi:hypothetical protein